MGSRIWQTIRMVQASTIFHIYHNYFYFITSPGINHISHINIKLTCWGRIFVYKPFDNFSEENRVNRLSS